MSTKDAPLVSDVRPESRPALFWAISDSLVLMRRSVLHIFRNLDQLLGAVMMPIMFLVLFRYVYGGAINTGSIDYVNFMIAGILVQTSGFGATTTAVNIALDLQRGVIDRFRSLPMLSSALLMGHVVADLVRNTISIVIMLLVALLVGFRPSASAGEWLLIFGLLMLFTFALSWLMAVFGLLVRTVEAANWVGFMLIMPLTFASSAFVPPRTMPGPLRAFAENQPITQVIDAVRAWSIGTPIGNKGWLALVWCVGIIVVAVPLSAWLFRRQTSK